MLSRVNIPGIDRLTIRRVDVTFVRLAAAILIFVGLVLLLMVAYDFNFVPMRILDTAPLQARCADGRSIEIESRRVTKPRTLHPIRQTKVGGWWTDCSTLACKEVVAQACGG